MGTWSTTTTLDGRPERVLDVLTDPDACSRWAPVSFDLQGLEGDRLAAGARARVGGRLAGRDVGFDVRILEAGDRRLALSASGPIEIEAAYDAVAVRDRTRLEATVSVRSSGGLSGRLATTAADALLAGGALDRALRRIGREVTA